MDYTLNSQNFEEEVLNSKLPVLVDFSADWCGPCKMMAPMVDEFAEEYEGELKVGKINVDQSPDIAQKYNVMSIPMFAFFKNGQVVETAVGALNKAKLQGIIDKVLA
ncbi:thioredoxin [Butyrivibrio sp. AE2032]|jgi:thioredoxin 1|uniref:thioredoxin n=1 Tax=Butyrivibrio sp. AE2032 TaxID=1458463 RepID=UPI000556D274|nr:thioredoxin [Butyrivibrio sp. AE2032]